MRAQPLVRLTGRGPATMVWLYFATMSILALWSLNEVRNPVPTILGVLLLAAVCGLLTTDLGERLSLWTTATTIAVLPIIALLISWQVLQPGGFGQWYVGAGTACLFYVSLRGRIVWAWAGFVALSLAVLLWGVTTDGMIATAFFQMAKQFPILVVGTLFAIGLQNTSTSVEQLAAETSTRAATEAADIAATAERNRRLAELDTFATPLLTLLMSGAPLTEEDRREFAVAEAELRDDLRARTLNVPSVVTAARDARRRGVDVVLLDDSDPLSISQDDLNTVIAQVSAALARAREGRVVVRLLPPGREGVATLLVDGEGSATNEVIGQSAHSG